MCIAKVRADRLSEGDLVRLDGRIGIVMFHEIDEEDGSVYIETTVPNHTEVEFEAGEVVEVVEDPSEVCY
jgi:peptide deformylase